MQSSQNLNDCMRAHFGSWLEVAKQRHHQELVEKGETSKKKTPQCLRNRTTYSKIHTVKISRAQKILRA